MGKLTIQETIIQIQHELALVISRQNKTRFYILLGGMGVPLSIALLGLIDNTTRTAITSTIGMLIVGGTTIAILLSIYWIGRDEIKAFERIKKLIDETEDTLNQRQDLQTILSISEEVYKSLSEKAILTEYIRIDYAYTSLSFDMGQLSRRLSIWQEIVILYTTILQNLQSDLLSEFEQRKQELRTGIIELQGLDGSHKIGIEEVSELQQSRLDKQIEQFEELQRVLIKV